LAKEKQLIRQVDNAFNTAIQNHDIDKLMSLLSPNIISLTHKADMPRAEGASTVKTLTEEFFKETPNSKVQAEESKLEISSSGDMAYLIGNYKMTYGDAINPKVDQGRYIFVLQKVNDNWRIVVHGGVAGIWDQPRDLASQR
jgi:ketosteroid isomerase-like protein